MSGSRVQATTHAPPDDLAAVVESFWCARWDLRGQPPHVTELLGDPAIHLSFEAGVGRIVGVWTRLWTRTLAEEGVVRAVKLHPGAGRAVLPRAVRDFSNRITPLDEAFDEVPDVLGPADDGDGLRVLADWLRPRLVITDDVRLAVRMMRRIRRTDLTRVDQLAEDAGMTVRAVQRLFAEHVGATPKWVIRRHRLQEAALRVERGEVEQLADLALALGYADQAHLARDFRAATGRTLRGFESDLRR
ncbi:MAG: helix-turn-helix transcriptional regulator [Alphaproteobacteria bacterium]|nr:helix-turn-helix transcriptional regulator [Alphaproteobacteria bacterium]